MDLSLPDPDPLAAEMPAEAEPVYPDGVCESLCWGVLLGGYSSPPLVVPRAYL